MSLASPVTTADIAAAAACSTMKVRRATRTGQIDPPDLLHNQRAWLWTVAAAERAIAILKVDYRALRFKRASS